jgi:hypothetical protein
MIRYNCVCCKEEFYELNQTTYRHLNECASQNIQLRKNEILVLQEKIQSMIISQNKLITELQIIYNETQLKTKQNYDKTLQLLRDNPQIELYKSQLETQKILFTNKYNNELKQIQTNYKQQLENAYQEYEQKLYTVHGNCDLTKKKHIEQIEALTRITNELQNKYVFLQKEKKDIDLKFNEFNTEINHLKQLNADTIYEKNKLIKELVDKQKELIQNIEQLNITLNAKTSEVSAIQTQFDKDKEAYIQEIQSKLSIFKQQLVDKHAEQIQLTKEREKEIFELKRQIQDYKNKDDYYKDIQKQLQNTQNKLQEWIKKYNELESIKDKKDRKEDNKSQTRRSLRLQK